jgi:hypothetical protein
MYWGDETHAARFAMLVPSSSPMIGLEGVVDQEDLCFCLLRCVPLPTGFKDDSIRLTWLSDNFKNLLDDATEVYLIIYT